MLKFLIFIVFYLSIALFTSYSLIVTYLTLITIPIIYCAIKLKKDTLKTIPLSGWFFLAYIVTIIISIAANQDLREGYQFLSKVKYYLIPLLSIIPFTYLLQKLPFKENKKVYIRAFYTLTAVAVFASIIGLFAHFTKFNPIRPYEVVKQRNSGLFGHIMVYAYQTAIFLSMMIFITIKNKFFFKYLNGKFVLLSNLILSVGLFFSFTRGAILGLVASVFTINKKVTITIATTVVLSAGIVHLVDNKFYTNHVIRMSSNQIRIGCWLGAVAAFKEHPVLGIGYRNYQELSVDIKTRHQIQEADFYGHAHNDYLEVLAGTGIIGFIFYIGWLLLWLKDSYEDDLISNLVRSAIITFAIGGLTQSVTLDNENLIFVLTIYALHTAYRNTRYSKLTYNG